MPTEVEIPGVGIVEFPDSMNDAQIQSVIKTKFLKKQRTPQQEQKRAALQSEQKSVRGELLPKIAGAATDLGERLAYTARQMNPLTVLPNAAIGAGKGLGLLPQETPMIDAGTPAVYLPEPDIEAIRQRQKENAARGIPEIGPSPEVEAGLKGAGKDLASFFLTPEGISTMGIGAGVKGASAIPAIANRAMQAGFGLSIGSQIPEQIQGLQQAAEQGDVANTVRGLGGLSASAVLSPALIRGSLRGELTPREVEANALRQDAADESQLAATLKDLKLPAETPEVSPVAVAETMKRIAEEPATPTPIPEIAPLPEAAAVTPKKSKNKAVSAVTPDKAKELADALTRGQIVKQPEASVELNGKKYDKVDGKWTEGGGEVVNKFLIQKLEDAAKPTATPEPVAEPVTQPETPVATPAIPEPAKPVEAVKAPEPSVETPKPSEPVVEAKAPEQPAVKEPWQMTKDEFKQAERERHGPKGQEDVTFLGLSDEAIGKAMRYFEEKKRLTGKRTSEEILNDPWGHKNIIANALREGKPVPPEVLKDYPDLQKPTPVAETAKGEEVIGSVYQDTFNGNPVWMVQESAKRGFGDSIWKTKEEADSQAAILKRRQAERADAVLREEKQKAADEAARKEKADFNGFEAEKTPMQVGKLVSALSDKQVNWNGIVSSRRDAIRRLVAAGRIVDRSPNGKRRLIDKDGNFFGEDQTSKIGMDYAEYLIEQRKQQPTPQPAPAVEVQKAQEHVTDVAKSEGTRSAKDIKSELVTRLEGLLEKAVEPTKEQRAIMESKAMLPKQKIDAMKKSGLEQITVEIPEDGTFKIWNTKDAVQETLDRAKKISTSTAPPKNFTQRTVSKEQGKLFAEEAQALAKSEAQPQPPSKGGIKPTIGKRAGETGAIRIPDMVKLIDDAWDKITRKERYMYGFEDGAPRLSDRAVRVARGLLTSIGGEANRNVISLKEIATTAEGKIYGNQLGNAIRLGTTDLQRKGASAIVASGFDKSRLQEFLNNARVGRNIEAYKSVDYALKNFDALTPLANTVKDIFDRQFDKLKSNGIKVEYHTNFLPGMYDRTMLQGSSRPYLVVEGHGNGVSTSFKKAKTFETPFDAVEGGELRPITFDAADLVEQYISKTERLMNRKASFEGGPLRGLKDPFDKNPIITDLVPKPPPVGLAPIPGKPVEMVAPNGYVVFEPTPGQRVAVHERYAPYFEAMIAPSALRGKTVLGMPLYDLALQTAGGIKHGMLFIDTYHAAKMGWFGTMLTGSPNYRKGLAMLKYTDADLPRAVREGKITQEEADWALNNRKIVNQVIKEGLQVGRIAGDLHTSFAKSLQKMMVDVARKMGLPEGIAGKFEFTKWVFEDLSRGIITRAAAIEFERLKKMDPSKTDTEIARKVASDLNTRFGNLGKMSKVFYSNTMQDLSSFAFLAPQWVESLIRSEAMGVGQLAKAGAKAVTGKGFQVGTIGKGMMFGLAAMMAMTQIANIAFTGHPTWDNDKGHKMDTFVPDATGRTDGFYFNPTAMDMEIFHQLYSYSHKEPSMLKAMLRVGNNKLGPAMRTAQIGITEKDWDGRKLVGPGEYARAMAFSMLPVPLPISPPVKSLGGAYQRPGQFQRQGMASVGLKTEVAETPSQYVTLQAKKWMADSQDPAIVKKYNDWLKADRGQSDYKDFKAALQFQEEDEAKKYFAELIKSGKTLKQIAQVIRPFSVDNEGTPIGEKPFMTGDRRLEQQFIKQMDDRTRAKYDEARKRRLETYKFFLKTFAKQ